MSASVAGVPYAITRTPTCSNAEGIPFGVRGRLPRSAVFAYVLDDAPQRVGRGLGQHPVAEVEDVPPAATTIEHCRDPLGEDLPRRQAEHRVEVALERDLCAQSRSRLVEGYTPIDANAVRARRRQERQELAGSHAEVDAWHAEIGDAGEDTAGRRQDEVPI